MAQTTRRTGAAAGAGPKRSGGTRGSRPRPVPPPTHKGESEQSPTHPVCTVSFCPICAVVTMVGEVRPEFAQHLLAAGREVLLAVRAVIDARLEGLEEPPVRLERLTIE